LLDHVSVLALSLVDHVSVLALSLVDHVSVLALSLVDPRPIKAFHEEILIKVILILYSLETGRIHCINPPVQLSNKLMIKHLS
jgi:hypothetical protein